VSSIITAAREFRADVLRNDKAMLRQLSQVYSLIYKSLNRQFRELQRDIEQAQREGKTVNQDWLRRSFRYQQLIKQAKAEIGGYSNGVSRFIEAQQRRAIDLGQSHATSLIETALPDLTFARLPTQAIEELVGVLANGSPLNKVLDRLGRDAAQQIRETLITGLGSGHGAAKIASDIREAIDVPRWKALQIARTEVMRAYRQSTLRTYAENDDVLEGWIWHSTLSTRTCAACWALHGTFFPLSKQFFPSHVSCRCTPIPSVKGVKTNVQSGSVAFAELPVEDQQTILGPSRYEMYASGTALNDFVILTRDKDWGGAYQVRPLYAMKSRKRAA
jgi:SPP1 gp7 family putative phage head morphogenesis protein